MLNILIEIIYSFNRLLGFNNFILNKPILADCNGPQKLNTKLLGVCLNKITDINSGETLHFEHNLDNSLFVRIYNLSGIEVVSQDVTNNDDIYLSLPSGMYIVTMSNPETQEIVRQKKIVVTN